MTIFFIAYDVVIEAFARKFMIAIFALIGLSLLTLTAALDLDVVQGSLAAGRLFGINIGNSLLAPDLAMQKFFAMAAYPVFYLGVVFGVIASSSIAIDMLAPGRVEMLLSLPIRRSELVLGIFLGVVLINAMSLGFGVGGLALVLFFKLGVISPAPIAGALMALLGFLPVYAVMLLTSTLVRAGNVGTGSGTLFILLTSITSRRDAFLAMFEPGLRKDIIATLIAPLPRLHLLADAGHQAASQNSWIVSNALQPGLLSLIFTASCLLVAIFIVSGKNY